MRLSKLRIQNFRIFGDEMVEINFFNFTTLIGSNDSGKTSILLALERIFSQSQSKRRLSKIDFHIPPYCEDMPQEIHLYIEVLIEIPIDKTTDRERAPFTNIFRTSSTFPNPYIRIALKGKWVDNGTIEGEISQDYWYVNDDYKNELVVPEEEYLIRFSNTNRANFENIYVPAIRDPSQHLKYSVGTILWRISNYLKFKPENKIQIEESVKNLNQSFLNGESIKLVQNILNSTWKEYDYSRFRQKIRLSLSDSSFDDIIRQIEIKLADYHPKIMKELIQFGDGLRSLFYISLVSALLKIEREVLKENHADLLTDEINYPPSLTIISFEEPENHLSPQILGKTLKSLIGLSTENNIQIIITTHSPNILNRINPQWLQYLKRDLNTHYPKIKSIFLPDDSEEAFKYIKEAIRKFPELYFSDLVLLVEGDSEQYVIPRFFNEEHLSIDEYKLSCIPLGGRYVNYMWKLLTNLEIPFITLLDYDIYKEGQKRIAYVLKELWELKGEFIINDFSVNEESLDLLDEFSNEEIIKFLPSLEEYHNIYFSFPLDFDLMMLCHYPEKYKAVASRGPRIPEEPENLKRYMESCEKAIFNKILEENERKIFETDGCYELLPWHRLLFSNNKPFHHMSFISQIESEQLIENAPESIKKIIKKIHSILDIGDDSNGE